MPRYRKQMPENFPACAARYGNLRLRRMFGVGGVTIEIWRRQLGVRYTAMPKPAQRIVQKRRVQPKPARWSMEAIEDLEDYGGYSLARELGVCGGSDDAY